MGDLRFFSSYRVGSIVNQAIDLALVFKCSPYEFLGKDTEEIGLLSEAVSIRMNEIRAEGGGDG